MSGSNRENKGLEDWLTRGRPLSIRTRGVVRSRGATSAVPITAIELKQIKEIEELLQHLEEELPEILWVVVVDGSVDPFVEEMCLQTKRIHKDCKFWLVGSEEDKIPESSPLVSLDPLSLDPLKDDDFKFLRNLVADLVIIPSEPKDSQRTRVERWLHQSMYILIEKVEASVIQEIQSTGWISGRSNADIFVRVR